MGDMSLSRRRLLAGASATAALGVLGSGSVAHAKAPMLNAQAPAFYRFKLGSIEATVVSDGPLPIGEPNEHLLGPTDEEIGKMLTDHFLPTDNVVLRAERRWSSTPATSSSLFDTGMSSVKTLRSAMGRLAANLKQPASIPRTSTPSCSPTRISTIVGGIMAADGSRNFPNAQIYITQADFDFWTDEPSGSAPPCSRLRAGRARRTCCRTATASCSSRTARKSCRACRRCPRRATRSGTPVFVINSGGKTLFLRRRPRMHHVILVEKPRHRRSRSTPIRKQGVADAHQGAGHARGAAHAAARLPLCRGPASAISPSTATASATSRRRCNSRCRRSSRRSDGRGRVVPARRRPASID